MKSNNQESGAGIKDSEKVPSFECEAPPLEKETRFAVVMYGGISLAIYIHGVAQELLQMVRATARESDNEYRYYFGWHQLNDAEKVYRKLGETLKTKFVVDILSGTSAGGINAVYLAKALVNNQSMDVLKKLWVKDGDIGTLLNDALSVSDLAVSLSPKASSLLNNQRMYYKLLMALKEMRKSGPVDGQKPPFVNELDLYITATDIRGLNLPIKIENTLVNEMRYKNVFHFCYATKEASGDAENAIPATDKKDFNQFIKEFDPLLAFAARCTSSIPPAFEPVQLRDISEVLEVDEFKEYEYDLKRWRSIFGDYPATGSGDFELRYFGDGGYLDNKPFSYATETLLRRRADLPVDRKLIYIEPAPEHPEKQAKTKKRPNVVQNVAAALVSLPRQETIREDLNLIAERNQIIKNIKRVMETAAYKMPALTNNETRIEPDWIHSKEWCLKFLMDNDFLGWYGPGYITYHQLRVEGVIQNLSSAFSRAMGWSEGSSQENQMQELLKYWREEIYDISRPTNGKNKFSENDILFRLDLSFRMRKFNFLQSLVNTLLLNMSSLLEQKDNGQGYRTIMRMLETSRVSFTLNNDNKDEFVAELKNIKKRLNETYAFMRARGRTLRSRGLVDAKDVASNLAAYVEALTNIKTNINTKDRAFAADLIEKATLALASHLKKSEGDPESVMMYLHEAMDIASKDADKILARRQWQEGHDGGNTQEQATALTVREQIQKCLSYFYDDFEYYDMLTYPIQYGTDVGESDIVEVIRISPEEATKVWNEKDKGKKKLAGTKLLNFGAFFSSEWRENDMLWGRLDAAEILIKEVLKAGGEEDDEDYKIRMKDFQTKLETMPREENKAVKEDEPDSTDAQIDPLKMALNSILEDDFRPKLDSAIYRVASDKENWGIQASKALKFLNLGWKTGETRSIHSVLMKISNGLRVLTTKKRLLEYFKANYVIEQEFPKETINGVSRAVNVLGNILRDLSDDYPFMAGLKGSIKNITQVIGWFLFATQKISIANGIVGVFYICGVLLLLAGSFIPGLTDARIVGILTIILTVVAHISALNISNLFTGSIFKNKAGKVVTTVLSVLWGVSLAVFFAALFIMLYIGAIHLGTPIPDNILGRWLSAIIAMFTIK